MPLQELVEYFNDRFEEEHHLIFKPFVLQNNVVNGLFGQIRVSSTFKPVRYALEPNRIAGHTAKISVSTHDFQKLHLMSIENLLNDTIKQQTDFQSIVNLDRLCRTVHMLNYLPIMDLGGNLFLEVDPRHILSLKSNHGVYFEEVIAACGLATKNIVISMTVNNVYALHHEQLLEGLNNYRHRGYQIALNMDYIYSAKSIVDLITQLAPHYLRVKVPDFNNNSFDIKSNWYDTLNNLKTLLNKVGGKTIMRSIHKKEQALIALNAHFDFVEGNYYDTLATDHLTNGLGIVTLQ
ncbi:hypothetical protein DOJK_00040 [Patescibacteria group bacterium]|nr:hypothetical protein DOJK_00040 [Patescibacteria group bacterium]